MGKENVRNWKQKCGWERNYFSKKGHDVDMFFKESIVDMVKMHKKGIHVFPKDIDVVTGGFPCQDFSVAGKRNGFQSHKNHKGESIECHAASVETRGQLYMWMKEVIEITQPKIFIAENVKGLVNLSNVKDIIQSDFSAANGNGYIVLAPQVLHSADYGVPQSRERVIFIGIKKSALNKKALYELSKTQLSEKYNPYPPITHSYTTEGDHLKPFVQDFGYYTQVIPGCFFRLGVRNEAKGIIHNVHTPRFDIDESAIEIGMGNMAWLGATVKL